MERIDRFCAAARSHGASDLFLHAGKAPQLRIRGDLAVLDEPPLDPSEIDAFWTHCGVPLTAIDHDGSFSSGDGTRFRVNFFHALDGRGAVLRQIKTEIPSVDSLGLPVPLLTSWMGRRSGLVLVTGPTGSGKSTTVASCLDWLNQTLPRHIVTIEDPIEYVFQPRLALVTQREVGCDTPSFAEGLRRSLRQSPDVIFLGEIRDRASALTALQASETGHLVLSTLHSANVLDSLERLSRLFEVEEREGVLQVLSQQLLGIVCQRLLPALPEGQVLALEHFENLAVTRKWILEGKFRELSDFLGRGEEPTTRTFLQSLIELVRAGRISEESALNLAPNPHELRRQLRGIGAKSISRD